MSSLSSSSTLAQVKAAYADNASYDEDGSVSKAKAFVTACRILLLKMPSVAEQLGHARVEQEMSEIRRQLEAAQSYVATAAADAGGDGQVIHSDFGEFRD